MWPILLDMTKEESMQHLRCLEIDAYSGLVSAFRAQGILDHDKLKILKDTGTILNISQERHKAEIRRVVNDEKLSTIAYHVNGERHSADEWVEEGQRLIPLMARIAPQTAYSAIADEVADTASKLNKQLPSPSCTERKRPPPISPTHSNPPISDQCNKNLQFRMSEPDIKKRKLSLSLENSNLAQHLMGPPKISKIQQIYRQKTKARQKEQLVKLKSDDKQEYVHVQQLTTSKPHTQVLGQSPKMQQKLSINPVPSSLSASSSMQGSPKINILQNISIQPPIPAMCDEQKLEASCSDIELKDSVLQPGCSSDNMSSKVISKVVTNNPTNKVNQLTIKTTAGSCEKTIKVCAPRKTISSKTVTTSSGQKLIVVSNPQTLTTSSILQRTLTTIPFKNISLKPFDKFKIVTSTNNSPQQSPIQIQNSKQKVVAMRTTANKKMVPLSQVQVLNTKGGIKVLPLGGKIISKPNANSGSMYVMNTTSKENSETKSTSSTPILMSSKPQENSHVVYADENNTSQDSTNIIDESILKCSDRSSPNSLETYSVEYDNHILESNVAQIEIEENCKEDCNDEMVLVTNETCIVSEGESEKIEQEHDNNLYYAEGDGDNTSEEMEIVHPTIDVLSTVGSLDPITGQYSLKEKELAATSSMIESQTPEAESNTLN